MANVTCHRQPVVRVSLITIPGIRTQEALDIYRRLAQTRPDAFLPDLAGSL